MRDGLTVVAAILAMLIATIAVALVVVDAAHSGVVHCQAIGVCPTDDPPPRFVGPPARTF